MAPPEDLCLNIGGFFTEVISSKQWIIKYVEGLNCFVKMWIT